MFDKVGDGVITASDRIISQGVDVEADGGHRMNSPLAVWSLLLGLFQDIHVFHLRQKGEKIFLVVDLTWDVKDTRVVLRGVKKTILLLFTMVQNKRMTEVDFEALGLSVKDWRQFFFPVGTALICWSANVIHGLHSSFTVMRTNGSPVFDKNVLNLGRNVKISRLHHRWFIFKIMSSFSFGFLSAFCVWNFSLQGLLSAVAVGMTFNFIFSIKPPSTEMALV